MPLVLSFTNVTVVPSATRILSGVKPILVYRTITSEVGAVSVTVSSAVSADVLFPVGTGAMAFGSDVTPLVSVFVLPLRFVAVFVVVCSSDVSLISSVGASALFPNDHHPIISKMMIPTIMTIFCVFILKR